MCPRIGVFVLAAAVAGCGALFNSGPQTVAFTSAPSGAEVWIDGKRMGTTPLHLRLSKDDEYRVQFRLEDHRETGAMISREVSAKYVILDVLGGLFPVAIDAVTGSWYNLSTDAVHGALQSAEQGGVLEPEELEAVKRGVPADRFIRLPRAGDTR